MPSMGEVVRMRRKMSWERFIEGIFEEEERREEGVEVEGLLRRMEGGASARQGKRVSCGDSGTCCARVTF